MTSIEKNKQRMLRVNTRERVRERGWGVGRESIGVSKLENSEKVKQ